MALLELSFASGEESLSVRHFKVKEGMMTLFEVTLTARSPHADIDLESITGRSAGLRIGVGADPGRAAGRTYDGICRDIRMVRVEPTGLTTYELTIVPSLWRLTQRRDHRLFQHVSVPDIVDAVLRDWDLKATWKIDRASYPRLELRVQYGETDFAFMSRLLEEAGITLYYRDDPENGALFVFHDHPELEEDRPGLPVDFVDSAGQAQVGRVEHITAVTVGQEVRPGRYTLKDYDFRHTEFALLSHAAAAPAPEDRYEQYHHDPNAFLIETNKERPTGVRPVADDKGTARWDEAAGTKRATRSLEALRASRRSVTFTTNCIDLSPGVLFRIGGHPRTDLGSDRRLLAVDLVIEGAPGEEWTLTGVALFADQPYRPAQTTIKPRIQGVQTAVVVGPPGEEIYTDELGRVRVQFHWDRLGKRDPDSSMWMRVGQSWAGGGHGFFALPRVGHEVLVTYLDGDPDCPIIVGSVHNLSSSVPHPLPDNKTVTTWKSQSSPRNGGFNEIRLEDAAGREMIYEQAQRDKNQLVKNDQRIAVGGNNTRLVQGNDSVTVGENRTKAVQLNEVEAVGLNRTTSIGVNRNTVVGSDDATLVGSKWSVTMARGVTAKLAGELNGLMRGPLGSTLHAAVTSVFGIVPQIPLGGALGTAVDAPLALLHSAAAGAFRSVMALLDGRNDDPGPPPTSIEMVDRKIIFTTGEASIILDGPNITFVADGNVMIHAKGNAALLADKEASLAGDVEALVVSRTGNVVIQSGGDKHVHLNPLELTPDPAPIEEEACLHDRVLPEAVCVSCGAPMVTGDDGEPICLMDQIRAEQDKGIEDEPPAEK